MAEPVYTACATAAFGTEGLVSAELKSLGFQDARAGVGGAVFRADAEELYLANLRLRCADRVLIVLTEARCESFDALFRLVNGIPWEKHLTPDGRYNISGKCVRSRLMSVRDCQSIAKKALIERLKKATGRNTFPETGAAFAIDVSLHSDVARISLDTSGTALNRRGYRTWNGEAPLRETLAAALVALSPWRPGTPLHDPCCGTGTLVIEAALRAAHRAPGLNRGFACDAYPAFSRVDRDEMRSRLRGDVDDSRIGAIGGSDIDPDALDLAGRHVRQAGLDGLIALSRIPLQELQREELNGVFLCNPPYGERLGDQESCRALYGDLRQLQKRHPGWKLCAISSDPMFERAYGKRATRKRRLYNGRLECEFMVFE
mgnify:CR=1 FL=1